MDHFEKLRGWLKGCPALAGMEIHPERLPAMPDGAALVRRGMTRVDRKTDILGAARETWQETYLLRLKLGDAGGSAMERVQLWARENPCGFARCLLEKGRLTGFDGGAAVYEAALTLTFTVAAP